MLRLSSVHRGEDYTRGKERKLKVGFEEHSTFYV